LIRDKGAGGFGFGSFLFFGQLFVELASSMIKVCSLVRNCQFKVNGLEFWFGAWCLRFGVSGFRFQVSGFRFPVLGFGFQIWVSGFVFLRSRSVNQDSTYIKYQSKVVPPGVRLGTRCHTQSTALALLPPTIWGLLGLVEDLMVYLRNLFSFQADCLAVGVMLCLW
jgi:hypothetical protein